MGIEKKDQKVILEALGQAIDKNILETPNHLVKALEEASGGTPIDVLGAVPSKDRANVDFYFNHFKNLIPSTWTIARRGMEIILTPAAYGPGLKGYATDYDNTPNQPVLPEAVQDFSYDPYIESILDHMKEEGMNIDPLPEIELTNDLENAQDPLGKTAYYDPNAKKVVLFITGRHPKDVLRSFCHEMIHHMQNIEGRLGNITTTNTQEDDHLAKIEQEAHYLGSITLRHWEDKQKQQMDSAEKAPLDEQDLTELEDNEIKYWALYAHLFSILNKNPERYVELRRGMEGEELKALDYFWGLLAQDEINEELVMEGRYDSLVSKLAGITLKLVKNSHKRASATKTGTYLGKKIYYREGEDRPDIIDSEQKSILYLRLPEDLSDELRKEVPLNFVYILKIQFVEGLGGYNYGGDTFSDKDHSIIELRLEVDPENIPSSLNDIYLDSVDVIRHEIEHLTQGGENVNPSKALPSDQALRAKIMSGELPAIKYFTLKKEIPAMIQGLYMKAKKGKQSFADVVNSYLDRYTELIDQTTQAPYISLEDKEKILNLWRTYLPKLGIKKEYWF